MASRLSNRRYTRPGKRKKTRCELEAMALIEIDGLPNLNMGGSFHGKL